MDDVKKEYIKSRVKRLEEEKNPKRALQMRKVLERMLKGE